MKIIRVIFSEEAEIVYKHLNEVSAESKIERSILNAVNKKIDLIKSNYHYGDPVSKDLIPEEYNAKYGTTNLFRVELPNFWRMLYTLTNNDTEIEIIAFVLDIIDHDQYNNNFG